MTLPDVFLMTVCTFLAKVMGSWRSMDLYNSVIREKEMPLLKTANALKSDLDILAGVWTGFCANAMEKALLNTPLDSRNFPMISLDLFFSGCERERNQLK